MRHKAMLVITPGKHLLQCTACGVLMENRTGNLISYMRKVGKWHQTWQGLRDGDTVNTEAVNQ